MVWPFHDDDRVVEEALDSLKLCARELLVVVARLIDQAREEVNGRLVLEEGGHVKIREASKHGAA